MPRRSLIYTSALLVVFASFAIAQQENYPVHPDSKPQPGVPKGEIKGPFKWSSKIFPGTVRDYHLYIPSQYDASKPTPFIVVQDGLRRATGWKLPTVLDNLTHKGEVPAQIGIFIRPGEVPPLREGVQPRFNRSYEYDGLGDRYARFLLEEIIPEVAKSYNLSNDPNDRAIAGSSSGAICAFTAAWERPDEFRRVFSTIGTYVGLRGGDVYPVLIRKHEPKPIRIFLQDGSNDLNLYGGSWFHANMSMLSALQFAGYDVNHVWGEGGHNAKHGTAVCADAMRWLWRDYPRPIEPGVAPQRRTDLLLPGEGWELVSKGHKYTEGPAVNSAGEVFFSDIPNSRIHKIALDGTVSQFAENTAGANGLMFGPDGYLYACQKAGEAIVRFDTDGRMEPVIENAPSNDLVVLPRGGYYSDPDHNRIWHVNENGDRRIVDEGIERPNGLHTSPDQSLLNVADSLGRFTYSFQIQPDGSLKHKQTYGHLHIPDHILNSGADGMTVDTEGRLYVATRVGLQIIDQPGRVHLILERPQRKKLSNVVFGGPNLDTLFVTCTDKVYRRKVNAKGLRPADGPVDQPKPRL